MKKLTLKQHAKIQRGLFLLAVIMALLGRRFTESHFLLWITIGLVVVAFLYRFVFIRCPHCSDGLYGIRVFPRYCPSCGKSLEEKPSEELEHEQPD